MRLHLFALLIIVHGALAQSYPPSPGGDGKPMLGIRMTPVPINVQQKNDIGVYDGVLVRNVFPNTAAARMGIQPGDVILSVQGQKIDSMGTLRDVVSGQNVGDDVQVNVVRNGQAHNLGDRFGEWPEEIAEDEIDEEAEEKYRQMQARRAARMAKAKKEADKRRNSAGKPADSAAAGPDGEDYSPEAAAQELAEAAAPPFGLPGGDLLAGLPFQWSLALGVQVLDPLPDAAPLDWAPGELDAVEMRLAALPDFDLRCAFSVTPSTAF